MGKIIKSSTFLNFTLFLLAVICCPGEEANATFSCILRERNALLRFKASLLDPSGRLSSWNTSTDCCKWQGIKCDEISGHVIGLDLQNKRYGPSLLAHGDISAHAYASSSSNSSTAYMYGDINSSPSSSFMLHSEKLDSSILDLKHLSFLDLSGNDFHLTSIPPFLGSMGQMQHLNLSCSNFSGIVPHHIGNLSLLSVLDLSYNGMLGMFVDDFMWVSHLSVLMHLNMSMVDLSLTKDLLKVLNMLPFLVDLRMSYSELANRNLQHACVNSTLTHLEYLDLSHNRFHGELPCFLESMTSLRYLVLSSNYYTSFQKLHIAKLTYLFLDDNLISGPIPSSIGNLPALKSLDLSFNTINDSIPSTICNLTALEYLWLDNNHLTSLFPSCLGNLSALASLSLNDNQLTGLIPSSLGNLIELASLSLNGNRLTGLIPSSLGNLTALEYLSLDSNQLTGQIPSPMGNLSVLRVLRLHQNQLHGEIPISLGQLSNLVFLDLSDNNLNGTITESHLAMHSKLQYLQISNNPVKLGVGSNWIPPFQLIEFQMNEIAGGEFPQWLQTQRELDSLSMSNSSISGYLPNGLPFIKMTELDLSHNSIHGAIPDSLGQMRYLYYLDLSHNSFDGAIPHSIGQLKSLAELDLSHNSIDGAIPDTLCQLESLAILDLSRNTLSDDLPECWEMLKNLRFLSLSSNRLSGVIPNSIGRANSLVWLQLNDNKLSGELPYNLLRNSTSLEVLDVGENSISGKLPRWIGNYLSNLRVLRLSNNKLCGEIPSNLCQLQRLQILDLANNMLTKEIPHCLGSLSGMAFYNSINSPFNSSHSSLQLMIKGVKQEYFDTLIDVVYVDLSNNSLVGEIPVELTQLTALIFLNLSYNYLQGTIPQRIGDMNALESLDLSNNNIFGNIPGSLSNLNFLSHLNLSYNNLTGEIPTGYQLQTLEDTSIYEGNPGLCGGPLSKKCHENKSSNAPIVENHDVEDEDDKAERIWFYGVVITGFATGFWGAIGVLVFRRGWRYVYFKFTDGIIARIMGV